MKNWKLYLSFMLCLFAAVLCQQIISTSMINQQNKRDSAEIHHIKYGLFSINEWKKQLATIISDEITKLNLTAANEVELKKHVEIQLGGLIDNIEEKIENSNKGSIKGQLKQAFINAFVDVKEIKKGIPGYADAIIARMTKVKTEHILKASLLKRIGNYFDKTFENQDLTQLNRILARTQTTDIEAARTKLDPEIEARQNLLFNQAWLLIAISMAIFLLCGLGKSKLQPSRYFILLFILALLLLVGVTVPMIDMEAKISTMKFTLLDHPVSFENQVLYFQTKSILDVFWIMITHKDLAMKIVGVLMVAFSVVFPLLKMLSSLLYYYDFRKAKQNSLIKFFVLKSGKWSMSDVLIVAIFMAYIGFNGIITSQFGNLSAVDQDVVILTTNGTSLQPGFFIFLSYTLLALFLSGFLTRESELKV